MRKIWNASLVALKAGKPVLVLQVYESTVASTDPVHLLLLTAVAY